MTKEDVIYNFLENILSSENARSNNDLGFRRSVYVGKTRIIFYSTRKGSWRISAQYRREFLSFFYVGNLPISEYDLSKDPDLLNININNKDLQELCNNVYDDKRTMLK